MIWGPASPEASLRDRIARYISAPLSPVEVRELPCDVSFRHCPEAEWEIGPARIRAASVTHRGPTLGYRIDDGDSSLAYIPDHEPALGADLDRLEEDWISGFDLARDASLLIHDGQYADAEYPEHVGWGHSAARATRSPSPAAPAAERTVLFHHDPLHSDDFLDRLGAQAHASAGPRSAARPGAVELGAERAEYELPARARRSRAGRRPIAHANSRALLRFARTVLSTARIEAAAERSPLVGDAFEKARTPMPARSATAAAAGPTSSTRSRSPSGSPSTATRDDVLAAALLHDVVEDCDDRGRAAAREFGERVADLVAALTDDESIEDYARAQGRAPRPGRGGRRRRASRSTAADKLTNSRTLHERYATQGDAVRDEFKVPLELKLEVWEADAAMLRAEAPDLPFLDELEPQLSRLRADRVRQPLVQVPEAAPQRQHRQNTTNIAKARPR